MSHVRNLFGDPSNYLRESPVAIIGALPERASTEIPKHIVAEAARSTEFAAVEARIRPEQRLIVHTDPRGPATDRFRFLRMRLRELRAAGKLQSLLVTSPLAHDGRTTVVLNLATTLAEHGKRPVLVVEADLQHGNLPRHLGLENWNGVATCLQNDACPLKMIRRLDPLGWCLLPAGETRRNAAELLQTPAFGNLMQRVAPHFDWILVDSPPAVPLTDAVSLQHHVDATLLVVRAGQTPREALEQTVAVLGRTKICGVVFNGLDPREHPSYRYAPDRNRGAARLEVAPERPGSE